MTWPWEAAAAELTPVETLSSGMRVKRDDLFAPLGPGGINGSKLRQLVWLVGQAARRGARGLVTAASVRSPQLPMVALVGGHFGLPVTICVGGTNPVAAVRHRGVRIAVEAGAEILYGKVPYNPALQAAARHETAARPGTAMIEYGITTMPGAGPATVKAFHSCGSVQAEAVPDDVDTVVIPFGSGNSAASILLGLATSTPANLYRVVLVGIGPCRLDWLRDRLVKIEEAGGPPVADLFPIPEEPFSTVWGPRMTVEHVDLHGSGWCTYSDRRPYSLDGIVLHPTYEGKLAQWADETGPNWWGSPGSLLWIVGSEPVR